MRAKFCVCFCVLTLSLISQNSSDSLSGSMNFDKNWIYLQDTTFHSLRGLNRINDMPFSLKMTENAFLNSKFNNSVPIKLNIPTFQPKFDYTINTYSTIALNEKMWINTARINNNYIGLGGLSSAGAIFNYRINDNITFSGGATFSKFNIYNNFSNNLNLNSNMRFELTNRFFVNVFGSYSPLTSGNGSIFQSMNSSMYPQTHYGGSFEFKVTDKWGVMTGVERVFDTFKGKWVTNPFVMPVFYAK